MRRGLTGRGLVRLGRLIRQPRFRNAATLGLVLLGPVLAGLTYYVLGPLDQGASSPALRLVILADLVYALVVAALVGRDVARMVAARRARSAGSRLHMRLVGVFALLALIPAVLVAVFSVLTINVGLEGWFSERVRQVVSTSLAAAQAYEQEHREELARDGRELAEFLEAENEAARRRADFGLSDGDLRQALGRVQARIERGLTEAFVIDGDGTIRARGARSYEFGYERPSPEDFATAQAEGVAIIEDWANNEFRALIPLDGFVDRWLFVTRAVDGGILSLLDETQATVELYRQLDADKGRLLFEFGLLYLGFSVILILAAVWLALWYAEGLSRPVGRLLVASERVGRGDLDVRVIEEEGDDEIAALARHFNDMTGKLKAQRDRLLDTAEQIEGRRRLFDSVLSSVSSGVVGLDAEGRVTFANRSARRLLGEVEANMPLSLAVPEFAPLFQMLRAEGRELLQEQVSLLRGGRQEILLVRLSPRLSEEGALEGYVLAFDDVTDLVSAQRMAAWGDVARRIAHEIKNPLTPIRLSAERVKRKFARRLSAEEAADLEQMTDVIVRQTEDLRRIVDEFSRFARMPVPERRDADLSRILRDAVTLQEAGQPGVRFELVLPAHPVPAEVDPGLISQALTNLMKNAGEAIEARAEREPDSPFDPCIRVMLTQEGARATIIVEDNGTGLPQDRSRLFEPYVTTREKGTGLGLPIVRKIVEEHGGTLALEDAEGRGARAVIRLPAKVAPTEGAGHQSEAVHIMQATRRAV
ncbi:Signal transduction histidine kinase involved in nitrogen fixation and metabolism regulation [Rubellimicrobium thermophilum DSM 16684]|uniref:histidine kinase n=1 Tax=Rubellimicrobium thermophilum DSM 16684 TaxID=1123069 RepID=S9R2P1_9RHOB|nr:ATP-binding protein [Rubellimicrobium thermophilum]EPX86162.1 Signal transduction histidine kinase involved in nitrogen fixation and metabolism regulation [Rubellimicrobium thermophilum DSM 16684]